MSIIMPTPVKKVNYLNNKDMLKEIHKSKNSFSEYIDPKYQDYDIIVETREDVFKLSSSRIELDEGGNEITINEPSTIEKAQQNKAARIAAKSYELAIAAAGVSPLKEKPKLAEFKIDPLTIPVTDLVFRIHTYEHILESPGRKKTPKREADEYAKLNFKPYKHFILESDGITLTEVGRSHSKDGKYSITHGCITNKLAQMFILLVNKYGQRSNWRSYCVDEETEALTQRGWLNYNEINEDDTILSYAEGDLKWSSIKSIYRGEYDGLMHKLSNKSGSLDSLVTPNHKLVTDRGLIPVELMKDSDKLILLGDKLKTTHDKIYTDEFVNLINIEDLTMEIINKLTTDQYKILITKIYTSGTFNLINKSQLDLIQTLWTITGFRTKISSDDKTFDYHDSTMFLKNIINFKSIDLNGGKRNDRAFNRVPKETHPNVPTVQYNGIVWCPETEYGCFVARRNNTVFLTGNTYLDEMKGQALLQLSQVGLQFDEYKSDNPFSFFSKVLEHSFTRVLNLEKKNQDLRDDLLIKSGASPSFSKQLAHEESIRHLREDALNNRDNE